MLVTSSIRHKLPRCLDYFVLGANCISFGTRFFLFSGVENRNEIYSSNQLVEKKVPRPVAVTCSVISRLPQNLKEADAPAPPPATVPVRPQPATAKIFAPRTEDMNKGFLMFSDDEPGLTSKPWLVASQSTIPILFSQCLRMNLRI